MVFYFEFFSTPDGAITDKIWRGHLGHAHLVFEVVNKLSV